jgi:hypothetical protein
MISERQRTAVAIAIWICWARHTARGYRNGRPETSEEAWARRWRNLPERTRQEFLDLADAAVAVIDSEEAA